MSHVSERRISVNRQSGAGEVESDDGAKAHDKEFMTTLAKGLAVAWRVRQRAAGHDVVAGGARGRPVAGNGAAHSAHADGARIRRTKRTAILTVVRHSQARLCLSRDPELDRACDALMRQLSEQFHEFCSAAILQGTEIVYVARVPARRIMSVDACGRHAAAGVSYRARAHSARLSRRSRAVAAAEVVAHRGLHAVDHHRHAGPVRSGPRRPRAGFLDRRRRARARSARDRGAGDRPQRPGGRRPQSEDALDAHDAQRDARAFSAELARDRRTDLRFGASDTRLALPLASDWPVSLVAVEYRTIVR